MNTNNQFEQAQQKLAEAKIALESGQVELAQTLLRESIALDDPWSESEAAILLALLHQDTPTEEIKTAKHPFNKSSEPLVDLRTQIINAIGEIEPFEPRNWYDHNKQMEFEDKFNNALNELGFILARSERERLFESIVADLLGYGALESYLPDDSIQSIYIQYYFLVRFEQKGRWHQGLTAFNDAAQLAKAIQRITNPFQTAVMDEIIHTRLPDGSCVDGVLTPLPQLFIRKYSKVPFQIEDLIRFGSITHELTEFLRACAIIGLRILVVGEAGAGKNTFINVFSGMLPNDERIITMEDCAVLQLYQEDVVPLESNPILPLDVLLKLQPDRIVYGDLLSSDVSQFVQACLVLPTWGMMRSRNAEAALRQLEISLMNQMPELDLPETRIMLSQSLDLIITLRKLPDGSRKVTEVVELRAVDHGAYDNHLLFTFEQTGIESHKIIGRIRPTGVFPKFLKILNVAGLNLDPSIFFVPYRTS